VGQTDSAWWGGAPSQFAFMLFTTIWSILVLAYIALTPIVLPSLHIPIVALALLSLTSLFWFAGSIAMAALIGVPDCNGNNFCQSAQAGVAFGFFNWIAFTALAIMEFMSSRGQGVADHKPGRPYSGA
jgi:hypothetical protein